MKIKEILKSNQPNDYKRLKKVSEKNKKRNRGKPNLTEAETRELMSNRHYRRGRGGAIKQVR